MKRRPVPLALAAALVVAAAAALFPAGGAWVAAGSLVVLAAAGAEAFARARSLRVEGASAFDSLERPDVPVESPADLRRLERTLGWKAYSSGDFHHRVAPVLSRILVSKLSGRGVDPRTQPELARRVAGPALEPLLDPPADDGATVETADIARMVDALEAL